MGFRNIVFDDRADFANPDRFPDADEIRISEGFTGVFEGVDTHASDAIVIVTGDTASIKRCWHRRIA